ncbi:MAG: toxin HipA [Burkholderiales bacterium RIFCSPLOWO2_02_FULL_57_36]|nr:MAG: toxin HipA [Burkholderiales bacterium RIFCSPLOWO2_02_FULL_57_36]
MAKNKAEREKFIAVYADWMPGNEPFKLGTLWPIAARGNETFAFEFDAAALNRPELCAYQLDPHLQLYAGRQFCPQGLANFGLFLDSSPDRWGRMLMKRRLDRQKRNGLVAPDKRLVESDYLLGVHDEFRVGALRFSLNDEGDFLDNNHNQAAPPFVQLRALEEASLSLERNPDDDSARVDDWLRMLISPGGSLGGARPKASVVDPDGHLWIAKFPSTRDTRNMAAWELVAITLAEACGINVPEARVDQFSSDHHTFLVRRFDRTDEGERLHFASAMTLTGHKDGDDESTGVSYLELAQVLIQHGADTNDDLRELWTRIVFNMYVSNTDDHLRNHGFLLDPARGWRLSPAYDINPIPDGGAGLKLNVNQDSNDLDIELALSVAPVFRLTTEKAQAIADHVKEVTSQWRTAAQALGVPQREINDMGYAFRLAGA